MKKNSLLFITSLALMCIFFTLGHTAFAESTERSAPYGIGKWLPSDQLLLGRWMAKLIKETESSGKPLLPVIEDFKHIIEEDPQLYMLFNQMFDQVPHSTSFRTDPAGTPRITNYLQMLSAMNRILTTAPEFNKTGLVGFSHQCHPCLAHGDTCRNHGFSERKGEPAIENNTEPVGTILELGGLMLRVE